MQEPIPLNASKSEAPNIKSTINKLRLLDPIRMKRIDVIMKTRKHLLEGLRRDDAESTLGANRIYWLLDFKGTEGKLVKEASEGLMRGTDLPGVGTRSLWTEVLTTMCGAVGEARRTQIYMDLLKAIGATRSSGLKEAMQQVINKLIEVDPEITNRATDDAYFRTSILETQKNFIDDTLDRLF